MWWSAAAGARGWARRWRAGFAGGIITALSGITVRHELEKRGAGPATEK